MEWIEKGIMVWGFVIIFIIYLYNKYPIFFNMLFSRLRKLFILKSKKSENAVNYSDEEMIYIIQGLINRYLEDKEYIAKQVIKRIKEIVS